MDKSIEEFKGDFSADLTALRQDVAKITEKLSEFVQNKAHDTGATVSAAADDAKNAINTAATEAKNSFKAAGVNAEAYIERNPMTAVMVAFGVGMSLGLLNRSRG